MINLDSITNENNKEHNEKWPYISDYPYKILIIGGSGSGKTKKLLNLIKKEDKRDVIDKIYLYARDLSEPKYVYLIKKREDAGINIQTIQTYLSSVQKRWMIFMRILMIITQKEIKKVLIVFDDMIADIMGNKKISSHNQGIVY